MKKRIIKIPCFNMIINSIAEICKNTSKLQGKTSDYGNYNKNPILI